MESPDNSTIYDVGAEREFRFSVGEGATVHLELTSGYAEIFGYELLQHKIYSFTPYTSVSLFSWKGCQVRLWGTAENVCLSANTLVMLHVSMHARLEEMRISAHSRNKKGPVCLVAGPTESGKSSFCKLLLNYAARLRWRPLYVDLNVIHNTLSFPSVCSVLPVESQLDVKDGLNPQGLSMFNFGFPNPKQNRILYYLLIKTLGKMSVERLESEDPRNRSSGVVIDTCTWAKDRGAVYEALTLAVSAFRVDVVFVVEDEGLFAQFQNDMPSSVQVVYIPKQEGVVQRDNLLRSDIHANRIFEYFYGPYETPLNPFHFEVQFTDVEIYRSKAPKYVDLVGFDPHKVRLKDAKVKQMRFDYGLENRIFGIAAADTFDENLLVTSVRGFVCVLKVDKERKVMTVLCPQPAPLPNRILVLTLLRLKRPQKFRVRETVDYTIDT